MAITFYKMYCGSTIVRVLSKKALSPQSGSMKFILLRISIRFVKVNGILFITKVIASRSRCTPTTLRWAGWAHKRKDESSSGIAHLRRVATFFIVKRVYVLLTPLPPAVSTLKWCSDRCVVLKWNPFARLWRSRCWRKWSSDATLLRQIISACTLLRVVDSLISFEKDFNLSNLSDRWLEANVSFQWNSRW